MPLPFTSTDRYSRMRGPLLVGHVHATPDPSGVPSGVICIQSTAASLSNQVISTGATELASFLYIPVSTGSVIGGSAPPYVGGFTPLVWNDNAKALAIWSSGSSGWLQQTSTVGGGYWTSS